MLLPDRLPSLVLLVGCWVPAAATGWAAAGALQRSKTPMGKTRLYGLMGTVAAGWTAVWFLFQLDRIPPYVPGATTDPTFAPPEAVRGLAIVAAAVVLPASVIACALAYRTRRRG